MDNQLLVRWKMNGQLIVEGVAQPRAKGEEDILAVDQAKKLWRNGYVEIVNLEETERRRCGCPS